MGNYGWLIRPAWVIYVGQGLAVMPCARWPTACTLNGPLHGGGYQTGATLGWVDGSELKEPL